MQVNQFDYKLPENLIAKHPPKVRGASRLLVLARSSGHISHGKYSDVIDYLNEGDVLVINETKVIKARLITQNLKGNTRELLLLEKHSNDKDWYQHRALHRGKVSKNEILDIHGYKIEVIDILDEGVVLLKSKTDLSKLAIEFGAVPLPPYMNRDATNEDVERYQTEFAEDPGSVAAPTASLNMTKQLLDNLAYKGVVIAPLTLHVGMGTFLPIRSDDLTKHKMHQEYFEIPSQSVKSIQDAKSNNKRVVAVGTTVTRALEYAQKKHNFLSEKPRTISDEADIFIYPGYNFEVIDSLLTNFHAPKSTVLMMASAFAGWQYISSAYSQAIEQKYSLLSYGDSMLIV